MKKFVVTGIAIGFDMEKEVKIEIKASSKNEALIKFKEKFAYIIKDICEA